MEWRIGEIFEFGGEWYQCVIGYSCNDCAFNNDNCEERERITLKNKLTKEEITGLCTSKLRSDGKSVIFKKLKKVGEPYEYLGMSIIMVQEYILANANYIWEYSQDVFVMDCQNGKVAIEIKQNKEDMEEKKAPLPKEDNHLTRTVYAYVNGKISDKELIRSIKEMSDEYPYDKNSLEPFSFEAAKAGKPVCTRDGRKARIICFDCKDQHYPIVALIECDDTEVVQNYSNKGEAIIGNEWDKDLMMLPEKKEGWINIIKTEDGGYCYNGEVHSDYNNAFIENINVLDNRGITAKIEWEE